LFTEGKNFAWRDSMFSVWMTESEASVCVLNLRRPLRAK
jgi:hypothetical protein